MKKLRKLLVVAITCSVGLTSTLVHAVNYCSGTLYEYLVNSEGGVIVRTAFRNDWTQICSVEGDWNGIPSQTCFAWLGIANAAKTQNKAFGVYYSGDVTCSTIAVYASSPKPYYVRVEP